MKETTEKKGSSRTQVHHAVQVEFRVHHQAQPLQENSKWEISWSKPLMKRCPNKTKVHSTQKESHDTMTPEKLNDLYKEAVKPLQTKYDFTSMTLTDEK